MAEKPKAKNSAAERELDKAEEQFKAFEENVQSLTLDRLSAAPKADIEPQTKMSQKEIDRSKDIYLKPRRTYPSKEKFNERFREEYNFAKEYVHFTSENKEIIGESIEITTKPFPGMPAEEWVVPVNKPVWGPRYLAERIDGCTYSRLEMDDGAITGGSEKSFAWQGKMVVDRKIPRLAALPVSTRKSIFMGANGF
jgi:hypothetical protein